jgi:hypothetical protein
MTTLLVELKVLGSRGCWRPPPSSKKMLEPTTGLEPVNLFLTKEVLYLLSYVGLSLPRMV